MLRRSHFALLASLPIANNGFPIAVNVGEVAVALRRNQAASSVTTHGSYFEKTMEDCVPKYETQPVTLKDMEWIAAGGLTGARVPDCSDGTCSPQDNAAAVAQTRRRYLRQHKNPSIMGTLLCVSGYSLFALTFGYHIGKPVYDAYTDYEGADEED
jgi:hypothetical protein